MNLYLRDALFLVSVFVLIALNAFFVPCELIPRDAVIEWEFEPVQCWPTDPKGRPWHLLGDAEYV